MPAVDNFYEGQEIGASKAAVHFIKPPRQEMSVSVCDVDKYPCALTRASNALNVEQWHAFAPQGSIL